MDLFDKMALWARRYEPQVNTRTGNTEFSLRDLLETFRHKTILELTPVIGGKAGATHRSDPVRKLKISLLDEGISSFGSEVVSNYDFLSTGPSGDLARVKVIGRGSNGASVGELQMLIAQRMPELYFQEDPIIAAVKESESRSN
jgi:hypothetical protein